MRRSLLFFLAAMAGASACASPWSLLVSPLLRLSHYFGGDFFALHLCDIYIEMRLGRGDVASPGLAEVVSALAEAGSRVRGRAKPKQA